ncbi:MAG TPA: hypothetical protein PLB10_16105 [Thiolinea sp.]|nr:hypothetical protein [Thiolinea sp.]
MSRKVDNPLFFCNTGWMNWYEGLEGQADRLIGGGSFVDENGWGGEVCNFLVADDGFVYGYVETGKGDVDRKVSLERLGGGGHSVSGVDVVWTAKNPSTGGRYVVGWYKNATVFRERQFFSEAVSEQHQRDDLKSYRIRGLSQNCVRLDVKQRQVRMGSGTGFMGMTPWWYPPENAVGEVREFVDQVRGLLETVAAGLDGQVEKTLRMPNTPAAASSPYVRYIQAHEVTVSPEHHKLQQAFEHFLQRKGFKEIKSDMASVDVRFRDEGELVLAEIKPCTPDNVRFAIRTAMGQLLDYAQKEQAPWLLIVVGHEPEQLEQDLALSNGFGLAFPVRRGFSLIWPK